MRRSLSKSGQLVLTAVLFLFVALPLIFNAGMKRSQEIVYKNVRPESFIEVIAPVAKELGSAYGIRPSLLIAQASVETDFGRNLLGKYHNLYGLKSLDGRSSVSLGEKLAVNGKERWQTVSYQVYPTWAASMRDYLDRLRQGEFGDNLYEKLVQAENATQASSELVLSNFKSDKAFANDMIEVIKTYELEKYDK